MPRRLVELEKLGQREDLAAGGTGEDVSISEGEGRLSGVGLGRRRHGEVGVGEGVGA